MNYLSLFNIEIVHSYYADQRCDDFLIVPTAETQKILKDFRCILKSRSGGMEILSPVIKPEIPLIPIPADLTMSFSLQLQNPNFALFTDLTEFQKIAAPLYSNHGIDQQLRLVSRESKSHKYPGNIFAGVEISFNSESMRKLGKEKKFQIVFNARNLRWKYYVVIEKNLPAPAIEDKDKVIVFKIVDHAESADDAISQKLSAQYPNKQYFRFISDSPLPCKEAVRKTIQLQLDGGKVVDALPNPSFQNFTLDLRDSDKEFVLYQIIKYMNH